MGQFTLPLLQAVAADGAPLALAPARPAVAGSEVTAPFSPAPPPLAASPQDNPNDLLYATFLGGSGGDYVGAIAVDGAGNAYVTGWTVSSNFPTTPGAYQTSYNGGNYDAFVAKLNPAGSGLLYATFLGGSGYELGSGIDVDGSGAAYVTGETGSSNFPTTPGAFDTTYNGVYGDVFVAKLNPAGSGLLYATFLGGSNSDYGDGIAVDGSGAAYVTGVTWSSDFPTTPGAFDTTYSGGDAFVAKLALGGGGGPTPTPTPTSTPTPTPGSGLSIAHIEVTQAIQDASNSVPLIAGKPTFVRVYVSCPADGQVPEEAAIALRGFGPSGELPGSPLALAPFSGYLRTACQESLAQQRGDLRKTLKFTLPLEWRTGTVTLTAEVGTATRSETVTFQPARTLNVIYVPIRYKGQSPDPTRIPIGSTWAFRVYPTAQIIYVPGTTLDWNRCLEESLLCLRRNANTKALLNELTTRYRLVNAYVFGWLPEGTFGGGISDPTWFGGAGKAAFGDDDSKEGQRIFTHEIAHLMGRRHTNSSSCWPDRIDPDTDWPYTASNSLIQDYGLDGYGFGWLISSSTAVKNPANTYDYMSYCGSLAEGNVWTSGWTYEHIYSETLKIQTTSLTARPLSTSQPYFIASGLVYTDDTAILDPIWVITSTEAPQTPPSGTQYCLEAQDASGTMLSGHCFDLTFINYETGEATEVDGFNLMLPYPTGVARIVLKKGTQELAVQPVSAHAPEVTVLSPNGGENWSATGTYTITWTAGDADGDPLTYSVLYSPDGSEWVPVAMGITQTQAVVNAAELAGGSGARIRVLASDGVNTTADESNAPFTVGRKGPQAFILAPEGDVTIPVGTPLWLEGYAYDLEDGTLADAALSWSSSRDGDLGIGAQVLTTLSLGQHTLTFTATDSDANTGTATVQVLATFPEDVVPDCGIDVQDVQAVASRWRQRAGDPGWDPRFDLDGDGDVDIVDIMRVTAQWGRSCP